MSDAGRVPVINPFEPEYEPLTKTQELGQIACLPRDSQVFGFAVADYQPGAGEDFEPEVLARCLSDWEARHDVSLVSARTGADRIAVADRLSAAGFRFVELQIRATLPRLRSAKLRPSRLGVRAAADEDRLPLLDISASAFRFGRYHADPRFPRDLANLRYRRWLEAALDGVPNHSQVFVVGPPGRPGGFVHVTVDRRVADLRLAGVDPEGVGIAGPELFLGTLNHLALEGIDLVTARLSAANTSAVNLYASLSFRFHEPELVFHRGGAPVRKTAAAQ